MWRLSMMVLLTAVLAGCGGGETEVAEERDNTEEVQAFYAADPDFFTFATPADIPEDLEWEDGMDLPDLGSPEAEKGGTQFHYIADFPRTLRTVGPDSNGGFRQFILDEVTLGLAHEHPDVRGEYFPAIAEDWAVDYDNRTVYARIHPEARWSDGEPITTEDYFFAFFYHMSEYIVAPWYNNFYNTRYTNITQYDDHTLSMTMSEAKPDMASYALGLRPIPRHFYYALGDDFVERYQWEFQPTTGPYVLHDEDLNMGRSIRLTRNEDWWARDHKYFRNRYNPDQLHFSVIRDPNNVFEAFLRGDIDQTSLDLAESWYDRLPDDHPRVQNGYIHKSVFYNQRPRPNYGLWINTARPLLENRDIRLGIQYASNWDLVIESFFRGDFSRMNTARDGYDGFTHPDITARPFDIDQALEHFARAGFDERGPDGILVNSEGRRLSFTLSSGYQRFSEVLTILQEEARRAGLEFRIEMLDQTASWQKVQEKQHDIHFVAFNVSPELYPRYWDFYHSDNAYDDAFLDDGTVNPDRELKVQTNNLESFANYEMDQMIEQYDASSDIEEMRELSYQMQMLHHEAGSFVPGFVQDFFRLGHWRWVRYPEYFNHSIAHMSGSWPEGFVHWIDTDMKEETLAARESGETFEPQINVYDQHRVTEE